MMYYVYKRENNNLSITQYWDESEARSGWRNNDDTKLPPAGNSTVKRYNATVEVEVDGWAIIKITNLDKHSMVHFCTEDIMSFCSIEQLSFLKCWDCHANIPPGIELAWKFANM
jgi:hypothetical protein